MALSRTTWRDVQRMPDDGGRREAIDGELYVTGAPSLRHQRVSHRLVVALHEVLERPGHGILAAAPVGVEFPASGEGVRPDLVFVASARSEIVADDWIRGAPDLVIEILSPPSEDRDRGVKLMLYLRHGVAEYWIVDPEAGAVEVWDSPDGKPRCRHHRDRLPVRVEGDVVGEIELAEVFARP